MMKKLQVSYIILGQEDNIMRENVDHKTGIKTKIKKNMTNWEKYLTDKQKG